MIGETVDHAQGRNLAGYTQPGGPLQGDFMDNLRGAGPGEYRITATVDSGKTYEVWLSLAP